MAAAQARDNGIPTADQGRRAQGSWEMQRREPLGSKDCSSSSRASSCPWVSSPDRPSSLKEPSSAGLWFFLFSTIL
ncbi:hypothetical protein GQ55_9G032200 [Panicum hallii var. hallii]|uniref:Uncharacterized protein n=2 Tax=Panicum hallii TaxID=206008 RepID=A0A2T7BZD8_9POAL|nr:hypothetical protein GQ55_9G032200 [Panicum hallii var. hallii]